MLAAATKDEADRSYREASFAREIGNFAPTYRAGEIVAVTESSHVTKLNKRTTGEDRENIEKFLEKLDRKQLPSIAGAKELMHERADAAIKLFSLLNPVRKPELDVRPAGRLGRAGPGRTASALSGFALGSAMPESALSAAWPRGLPALSTPSSAHR